MALKQVLAIGDLAARTGLSVSAIRFYEEKGLITPHRNAGGHRRYMRSDIRRLSFVMITQKLGFSIDEIAAEMRKLPKGRTPTAKDWEAISSRFITVLDEKINELTRMRNNLNGCIGCGCLSLDKCALYNAEDEKGQNGPGPQNIFPSRKEKA
ncbi:redox-sensitive transcriptional activator SoxR [Ponticaulis sp.]|uniref:redox-sensitive transcriptional activator SoxR n=1 Tax=Ponticaulis sp. TaxID=2020902 RepID=UPI000C5484A8|nr:redox-sensitive transcriptional activator SoxR [Ponticaulis sp.]MAJ08585.1 redox-sensitive transcriptional activator SoxR [Ponticaulis sp.]HBH89376.1 redox-sensitive transcriptional activator SoxR [Hyphomonadaceae bacterium]|tara:strand:+ start:26097 stop:26555 length:459 start_codon:yes stop_codon:yes gene_type:complete